MLWNDLREFLEKLEESGALKRVSGADWDLEIGTLTEMMVERGGPGLLFDDIPGYPKGFRVASNINRTPEHVAFTLGLDHAGTVQEVAEEWDRVISAAEPVPPVEVPTGPVFENTLAGDDIDLFKFPTPRWHELDQDRYIGTGVCVIQKDPETGYVNSGTYRIAIHDKNTCGIFMQPNNNGDIIRRKYWKRGEKCPVVLIFGQDPTLTMLSGGHMLHIPYGTSEFDLAGYVHKSPVPVVKGPVTGLPIPATAEIAVEGYILSPEERLLPEGPFGEFTGYYGHGRRPETVIEVSALYHRDDPIIFGSPPVRPLRTYADIRHVDLRTKARLEKAGIQGVQGVFTIAGPFFRVVSLKQMYAGHVDDVIHALEPGGEQWGGNHIWVLVDEDVDIQNTKEVLWAMGTRCIPQHGVTIIPGTATDQLDPRIPPGDQSDPTKEGRTSYEAHNLIINACRPYEWKDQFPPVAKNSDELRDQAEEKWKWLFEGVPTL